MMQQPDRRRNKLKPALKGARKLARGLSVRKSRIDGLGCFAATHFPKGGLVAEYAGQRINHREAMRRMRRPGPKHVSELSRDCYIDGSVGGNGSQYINHSCEPNADVLIIDAVMLIIPLRDIAPGEEITIDYLNSFEEDLTVCRCRSASCRRRANRKAA
jgi:SET domain-containing protein